MILDTNAISALADGDQGVESIVRGADELAIPSIVLGEYWFGVKQSRDRTRYEAWLLALLPDCRILAIDEETAAAYAELRLELKRLRRPIPSNDLWIAALTRQFAQMLVSQDRHFDSVPKLKRLSW